MRKIYLNLPTLKELERLLQSTFLLSDALTEADIVITEGELEFISNKLVIAITDKPESHGIVRISRNLSTEAIYQAVRASVDTYALTVNPVSLNPVYHVLKDSDPKVGYLVKKLENILNAASESILEIDSDGSILFHNKKFAEIYDNPLVSVEGNIYTMFDDRTSKEIRLAIRDIKSEKPAEFSGKIKKRSGAEVPVEGHISVLPGDMYHYEIIFEDITDKLKHIQEARQMQEQTIVAGFARHLSHNVMNALTAAGGFIRQVRAKTDNNLHLQNLWHIIDEKLLLIEEIVAGYNDYTYSLFMLKTERTDIAAFFKELVTSIAEKKIDRNFSAYLYKFTDNYELTYDFSKCNKFEMEANVKFLKLALCYLIKDNIRYFFSDSALKYSVVIETTETAFNITIKILNVDIPEGIIETMFKPWNHQMLSQSFDYWGIVIANTIIENHSGKMVAMREGNCFRLDISFSKH